MKDCLIIGPVHTLCRKEVVELLKKKILTVTERAVDFLPVIHQEGANYDPAEYHKYLETTAQE